MQMRDGCSRSGRRCSPDRDWKAFTQRIADRCQCLGAPDQVGGIRSVLENAFDGHRRARRAGRSAGEIDRDVYPKVDDRNADLLGDRLHVVAETTADGEREKLTAIKAEPVALGRTFRAVCDDGVTTRASEASSSAWQKTIFDRG